MSSDPVRQLDRDIRGVGAQLRLRLARLPCMSID